MPALVRLVEQAGSERAPFVRIADRYAAIFLPVTAVVAGLAWAVSGDPVRALAVFVVATPCPLILAAPIALMSGDLALRPRAASSSRARRRSSGSASARSVLLDKTGTVTLGRPRARPRRAAGRARAPTETLRLAASVDRLSSHPLAKALVAGAEARGARSSTSRAAWSSRSGGHRGARGRAPRLSSGAGAGSPTTASRRRCRPRSSGEAKVLVAVDGPRPASR